MTTLDINTNGAWRTVINDLRPSQEDEVKAACVQITNGAGLAGGARAAPSWRLRDAEGKVYLRCAFARDAEGAVTTAWSAVQ